MSQASLIEKENVVMRAGDCSVTLLPALGGKIASIRVGQQELLQTPLLPYAPRSRTMSFDEADASGWDECLPSVASCTVETANGVAAIPDHGDLWRVRWAEIRDQSSGSDLCESVSLRGECFSLPLALERTATLQETASGWKLELDYLLHNTGNSPTPWSWAAHPLFVAGAGDRIVLPTSIKSLRLEGSGGGRLGKGGDQVSWPVATLADGTTSDLNLAQGPESEIGDKLFAGPLGRAENWCVLERPKAGLSIRIAFNTAATPYLGLWICYGGWPERPGAKQICVALEPATAPVDSLAQTGTWSRTLGAGETFSWTMTVEIQSIVKVN
jgi:galactose mutarotase-like enzyme